MATLVIDAGIVAVSSVIPDTIEPDFINKAANKRIDQYTEAIVEAIKDPIGVIESVSQTISDTYEEEGIMYVTGNAASSFIPIVGMATKLSKISKLTSKIPDSKPKPVSDTIKAKVDDLVKNNKAFEGFKKGTLQFVKGVKGGAVSVVGGMKKMVNPDHNVVYSTGGPMPWKVTNPKIVQDRIEDVTSQFAVKVEGKGEGAEHVGRLKGQEVLLKDILEKEVTYTKRDREEFKQLRNKFNSFVRKNFLQDLASDEKKIKQLFDAGLTETDIKNLKSGLVPDGYQVHHKLPLDDGGTNDFKNLILIKNDPYHKVLTNSQKDLTKGMKVGDSINIKWPIPEGSIYPTTKK